MGKDRASEADSRESEAQGEDTAGRDRGDVLLCVVRRGFVYLCSLKERQVLL